MYSLKLVKTIENLIPRSESHRRYACRTIPLDTNHAYVCCSCISKYGLKEIYECDYSVVAEYMSACCEVINCSKEARYQIIIDFTKFDKVWGPYN